MTVQQLPGTVWRERGPTPVLGLLLEYLSEVGAGTWSEFKYAIATSESPADRPASWIAHDLAALGHIEFDQRDRSWSVCPPALAQLPSGNRQAAVLCGARSPAFRKRAWDLADEAGGKFDLAMEGGVVDRVTFRFPDDDSLALFASCLEIPLIPDAARALAACLPPVRSFLRLGVVEPVPESSRLERLIDDPDLIRASPWLRWQQAESADNPGVYRVPFVFGSAYWLVADGQAWRTEKAVALYSHIPWLMRYKAGSRAMWFPREVRPPALYLRTLVLCSGSLPTFESAGRLVAKDIPDDIAETVLNRLGQEPW